MKTDQARAILAAADNRDRALANLRNAAAMSTDDPRATEMLESAGDAYVAAVLEAAVQTQPDVPGFAVSNHPDPALEADEPTGPAAVPDAEPKPDPPDEAA